MEKWINALLLPKTIIYLLERDGHGLDRILIVAQNTFFEDSIMFNHINLDQDFPNSIDIIVEIPRGSHSKFEYDENLGLIKLDRVLHSSVVYPTDYGFVPSTRSEDGDHVDVLLLTSDPLFPGCMVKALPIGLADMEDEAGKDWKILAVAKNDPRFASIRDLHDVDQHTLDEIQNFFEVYKQLENKKVLFSGWQAKESAKRVLNEAAKRFLDNG